MADELTATALKLLKEASVQIDWSYSETPATKMIPAIKKFKEDDPDYIFDRIGTKITDANKNKIMAILACLESDLPYEEWHIFEKVGEAFNNRAPIIDSYSPLTPGECAWAVECMDKVRYVNFDDEVRTYIAACLYDDGFVMCPKRLSFCQSHLNSMTRLTDLSPLTELYKKGAQTHKDEMLKIQLERLASVDAYLEVKGVIHGK